MGRREDNDNARRTFIIVAVIVIIISILSGLIVAIFWGNNSSLRDENTSSSESATASLYVPEETESWDVSIDGVNYVLNPDITTILFMGVDSDDSTTNYDVAGNGGRADTIALLILNNADQTMKILEISRDTMTNVLVYDDNRNLLYEGVMQLNLQYSFGESGSRSCYLMCNNVNSLLYGTPIDYYCSINLQGMRDVIDAMGGIDVTFDRDCTDVDPSYTEGSSAHLDAETAEHFIRYRDIEITGSNNLRMDRHTWFAYQLFDAMVSANTEALDSYYQAAGNNLTTDMSLDAIHGLRSYTLTDTYKVPGEVIEGAYHDEFYVDEEQLRDMIVELFYVEE